MTVAVAPRRVSSSLQPPESAALRVGATEVTLLQLIALSWVLDGALRKWVIPGAGQVLLLLPYGVVILAYLRAIARTPRLPPGRTLLAFMILALAVCFQFWHVLRGDISAGTAAGGVAGYLVFAGLPALFAQGSRQDLKRVLRVIVRLAGPLALLSLLQVVSPASAFVNRLFESDGSDNFLTTSGVVRPSTTFTSSAGSSLYALLLLAVLVSGTLATETGWNRAAYFVAMPCAGVLILTSGSRTAFLTAAVLVGIGLVLAVAVNPMKGFVGAIGLVVLGLASLVLVNRLAPNVLPAFQARVATASTFGNQNLRVTTPFTSFTPLVGRLSASGHGLGAALHQGQPSPTFYENELDRWVFDLGGVVACFVVGVRWLLTARLLQRALSHFRVSRLPLCLVAGALVTLLTGQVTTQAAVGEYAWISAALAFALLGAVAPGDPE